MFAKLAVSTVFCFFLSVSDAVRADDTPPRAAPPAGKDEPRKGSLSRIISITDVPKDIREAADGAAPKVQWLAAVAHGKGWYTIVGRDEAKRLVYFISEEAGTSIVQVVVPLTDVPRTVSDAVGLELPKFKPTSVRMCGKNVKALSVYRFQGEGYQGASGGVYVSADGSRMRVIKE